MALNIGQIVFGVLLVAAILLQNKGTELGAAFGGSGTIYRTKRGAEKFLFWATVVLAVAFFGSVSANIFIS